MKRSLALALALTLLGGAVAMADEPENATIVINGGASTTSSLNVTITTPVLHCPSGGDMKALEVSFSNDGVTWTIVKADGVDWPGTDADGCTAGALTTPTTDFEWTLAAGADGPRTVHARFRHGNDSVVTSATITYETTEADDSPAAPAVAAALLKAAGVDPRYGKGKDGGNCIAEVANEMGPETDFNGVAKSSVQPYEDAVRAFLNASEGACAVGGA